MNRSRSWSRRLWLGAQAVAAGVLSLILVVSLYFLVVSYHYKLAVGYKTPHDETKTGRNYFVSIAAGRLKLINYSKSLYKPEPGWFMYRTKPGPPDDRSVWRQTIRWIGIGHYGFAWERVNEPQYRLVVPIWSVSLVAAGGLLWLTRPIAFLPRRRWRREGRCDRCGYPLPEHPTYCPECGPAD